MITTDPLSIHIENTVVDGYSMRMFFMNGMIFCNYSEAYLTPTIFLNNATYILSKERTSPFDSIFFFTSSPGNITMSNIDAGRFYTSLLRKTPFIGFLMQQN